MRIPSPPIVEAPGGPDNQCPNLATAPYIRRPRFLPLDLAGASSTHSKTVTEHDDDHAKW